MSIIDKLLGHESEQPKDHPANPDMAMQKVLDVMQDDLHIIPYETLSPQEARRQPTPADAVKKILSDRGDDPNDEMEIATRDILIPGPAGDIKARLYAHEDADDSDMLPVVVYWHGGGWVIADIDVYDGGARGTAKMTGALVVSCHYRQAPEDKFPAAHDDAFAAYQWVLDNIQDFGGDPRKVAVMGESAGGNLALATAIRARDEGVALPVHMALVYPVAGADMNTPSYIENETAKPLGKALMQWFVSHVFADPSQAKDPRINLVEADLSGLPSATIVNAEIDPLRSEGEMLAERLEAAGSDVRQKTFNGSTHEFFGMARVVPDAAAAQTLVAHDLKKAFGTSILPI